MLIVLMFVVSVSAVAALQGHPLNEINAAGTALWNMPGSLNVNDIKTTKLSATGTSLFTGNVKINGILDMDNNEITGILMKTSPLDTDAVNVGYVKFHYDVLANNPSLNFWGLDAGNNIHLTDNAQFVGIGTGNPSYKLHVKDGDLNVQNGKILITSANSGELLKIQKGGKDILKVTDSKITISKDIEYSGNLINTKGFWNGAKWIAEGWSKECTANGGGAGQPDITGKLQVVNGKLEYSVTKGTAVETGVWEGLAKTIYTCMGAVCGHKNWVYWSGIGLLPINIDESFINNKMYSIYNKIYSSAPSLILISENSILFTHYCAITAGVDIITSG